MELGVRRALLHPLSLAAPGHEGISCGRRTREPAATCPGGKNTTLGRSLWSSAKGRIPQFYIHSPAHKHMCKSIDCPKVLSLFSNTVYMESTCVLFHDLLLSRSVLGEARHVDDGVVLYVHGRRDSTVWL